MERGQAGEAGSSMLSEVSQDIAHYLRGPKITPKVVAGRNKKCQKRTDGFGLVNKGSDEEPLS